MDEFFRYIFREMDRQRNIAQCYAVISSGLALTVLFMAIDRKHLKEENANLKRATPCS